MKLTKNLILELRKEIENYPQDVELVEASLVNSDIDLVGRLVQINDPMSFDHGYRTMVLRKESINLGGMTDFYEVQRVNGLDLLQANRLRVVL